MHRRRRSASTASATTTSGRGTTCTPSSATRTRTSSRATPPWPAGRRRPSEHELGLLVGANTFRNPGIVAKSITTIDHISGGRAILGIGGAWMELEHQAHGIDFGSGFGQRLDWLDESTGALRALLDGETVTSEPGGHYAFDGLVHHPTPVQARLPIMIGGSGEKKTLRTVAKYADMWNAMGPLDVMAHKVEVLKEHCAAVGRDIADIEFTLGIEVHDPRLEGRGRPRLARGDGPQPDADGRRRGRRRRSGTARRRSSPIELRPYVELGFRTVISEQPAPYDVETLERFIGEVKPLIDQG